MCIKCYGFIRWKTVTHSGIFFVPFYGSHILELAELRILYRRRELLYLWSV